MALDPDFFTYLNIYNGPWLTQTPKLNGTNDNDDIVAGTRLLAIVLNGYGGNDRLTGNANMNEIFAGDGSDQLFGGDNADWLYGSGGNDYFEGGKGGDYLSGGTGTNTLSYASSEKGVTIDLRPNLANFITTATGGDAQGDIVVAEMQNAVGSENKDEINGTNGANVILGLSGDDSLYGNDGDDILSGGRGGDYIDGGQGTDTALYITSTARVKLNLSLGSALQQSGGEERGDQLISIENLIDSRYNDDLTGDSGINVLSGGGDNDYLTGLGGADTLNGGEGNDTALYQEIDADITIDLRLDVQHGPGGVEGDKLVSVENITSGAGADTLIGDAAANLLRSGDGEDRLEGMGGRDTLIGDDGDDQLEGGGDDDTLYGGMGNDTLLGGKGDDYLYAELDGSLAFGKNTLIGGDGKDWLYGGAHTRERFIGGAGTDYINGGGRDLAGFNDLVDYSDSPFDAITRAGVDVNLLSGVGRGNDAEGDFIEYLTVTDLTGSLGNDRLKGNEKSNSLKGLGGDDTLIGEKGIDTLIGGGGDDVLEGGEGLDTLVGGGGKDVLTGGGDSMDEFVFTAVSDSKAGADDTLDWIKDFDKMDYIHVNYIDFDVIDPEHNDPIFIDNADFSGKAGELRYTESSIRGAYRVEADINGDKTADFAFLLSGVSLTRFSFTSTPINIGEGRF